MEGFPKFIKPVATGLALMGALSATEVRAEHKLENKEKPKVGTSFTVGIEKMPGSVDVNKDASKNVETINISDAEKLRKLREENANIFSETDNNGNVQTEIIGGQK